jgi:PPK2 family polyphosphate:nucleotide phosphotransferase
MKPSQLIPPFGKPFHLSAHKPADTSGMIKEEADQLLAEQTARLPELHDLLYAEHKRSVLVVLQGMDASGKDGTIKHVVSGVNPRNCTVTSFKVPTARELDHDFLWRVHAAVPGKGEIAIFNRSHYEDVLVTRVHKLITPAECKRRYVHINAFEQMLAENGVTLLKFCLHISREEQHRRLDQRLADPHKNWKWSAADLKERRHWKQYQAAYEDAIGACNTPWAPWHVIPADRKWFRNYAVSEILVRTLENFGMKFPRRQP